MRQLTTEKRTTYQKLLEPILSAHLPGFNGFGVSGGLKMQSLGLDSLQAINILLDIEKAIGSALPDDEVSPKIFETPFTLLEFLVQVCERDIQNNV